MSNGYYITKTGTKVEITKTRPLDKIILTMRGRLKSGRPQLLRVGTQLLYGFIPEDIQVLSVPLYCENFKCLYINTKKIKVHNKCKVDMYLNIKL